MFFLLSKILDLALAPLSWCLLLMLWACWRPARARRAILMALGLLWLASVEPVSARLLSWVEEQWQAPPEGRKFDAVVLLGGVLSTMSEGGIPGYNDNVERLHTSFEMIRSGAAKDVVISGDFAGSRASEAELLRDKLVDWGVDPAHVVIEPKARNTRENALFTVPILRERGYQSVGLITSRYHMRRSLGCFRKVGFETTPVPADYRAAGEGVSWTAWFSPRAKYLEITTAMLREAAGYWIYKVSGYV